MTLLCLIAVVTTSNIAVLMSISLHFALSARREEIDAILCKHCTVSEDIMG